MVPPIGLAAPLIAGSIGTLLGPLAGFYGGWFDRIVRCAANFLMAFRAFLHGILRAALGSGFGDLVAAVAFMPQFI